MEIVRAIKAVIRNGMKFKTSYSTVSSNWVMTAFLLTTRLTRQLTTMTMMEVTKMRRQDQINVVVQMQQALS
jgi:hypothetical protein